MGPPEIANWIEELTTTTGTGPITLGTNPINGRTTFKQGLGNTVIDGVPYSIRSGNNRETGIGSYDGTTDVLTRTTIKSTLIGGIYNDINPTPLNLVGTSSVACTYNASLYREGDSAIWMRAIVASGGLIFPDAGVTIQEYDAVSGRVVVNVASYSTEALQPVMGLSPISAGAGELVNILVRGLYDMDTSAWAVGDRLWQGNAGSLTNVKPPVATGVDEITSLGVVVVSGISGKIFFQIDSFGNDLVKIAEPADDGFAKLREPGAWVRGGRIFEAATEPPGMSIGDIWIET